MLGSARGRWCNSSGLLTHFEKWNARLLPPECERGVSQLGVYVSRK